jgi:hypothetical protein
MNQIRPKITEERLHEIRHLIEENPDKHRSWISKRLCEDWGWKSPVGQLKDISCRDLLRQLEAEGRIKLPAARNRSRTAVEEEKVLHYSHDMTAIEAKLTELMPIELRVVAGREEFTEFKSYIDQYHYLGYGRSIGENMKYVVIDKDGRKLACMLFGSSAWKCQSRDEYIGWDRESRERNLYLTTNNTRFLIFPWVKAAHLASHILGIAARRISKDWEKKYGHPLYSLETFVERDRFRGTCYKAANWKHVGSTTGRGRNGISNHVKLPVKDVYVYPLQRDFKTLLIDTGAGRII